MSELNIHRAIERFHASWMPVTESGCWIWMGAISPQGYGQISVAGKTKRAHRFGYELFNGPVDKSLHMDHLCRVRCCVNPAHLEPVTPRENCLRGIGPSSVNSKKTHCNNGHPLEGGNLRVKGKRERQCKECQKAHLKAYDRLRIGAQTDKQLVLARYPGAIYGPLHGMAYIFESIMGMNIISIGETRRQAWARAARAIAKEKALMESPSLKVELTSKQQVLAKYPSAYAYMWRQKTAHGGDWVIYSGNSGDETLGSGTNSKQAWIDAARRLEQTPLPSNQEKV